jgi:hypothetical protein
MLLPTTTYCGFACSRSQNSSYGSFVGLKTTHNTMKNECWGAHATTTHEFFLYDVDSFLQTVCGVDHVIKGSVERTFRYTKTDTI